MAERRARWRGGIRWLLTIAIVAYAFIDWGGDEPAAPVAAVEEPGADAPLRIVSLSEADVSPGDAIAVVVDGADAAHPLDARVAGKAAHVVVRHGDHLVVRIPAETAPGRAGLRVVQGPRRSKSWDLQVREPKHKKLIAHLLGGLALFVYGLSLLAGGLRGLAGNRLRALLGRLTRSPPHAVGVGVAVGAFTQLTTSAAALSVGLLDAGLLTVAPAVAIFVGAQLGAAVTGALLPVGLAHQSLALIAIGVVWTRLGSTRRAQAIARLVLGLGLMLYGLHLLQTSIEPLVSSPKLLPYLDYLRQDDLVVHLECAAIGAVLAFVLQGPGPVYVLVLGVVRVSGALPLASGLAILAGTNLGAALGMAIVAWQSGEKPGVLARPHLAFGVAATAFALATLPLWPPASSSLRLAVAFVGTELAVVAVWLGVLPALTRHTARRRIRLRTGPVASPDTAALIAQQELAAAFARQKVAFDGALDIVCTGERTPAAASEEALAEARQRLEQQFTALSGSPGEVANRARQVVSAVVQLQRAIEQLVALSELGVERGLRLQPDEQERLRAMHALASASFDAAATAVEGDGLLDLEAATAREIRMNQLESESRSAIKAVKTKDSAAIRLGLGELIDAYEHVGNHLLRVAKAISYERDDLV